MQSNKVLALIKNEFVLEWRQKFALGGLLLYLVSMVFITYLAFDGVITVQAWNALFWLIMLFTAMNAILKGFVQEHGGLQLYYYTLVGAQEMIAAKIAYNAMLMVVLGFVAFLVFVVFMGNPLDMLFVYLANMVLGVIGFAAVLTLISAIASRAKNNFTLMAILGFPLILPMLLLLIRVSLACIHGAVPGDYLTDMVAVILLIIVTIVLSVILFPYIWKE